MQLILRRLATFGLLTIYSMNSDLLDSSIRLKISSESSQKFPAGSAKLSDLYDSSLALKELTDAASFTVDGS